MTNAPSAPDPLDALLREQFAPPPDAAFAALAAAAARPAAPRWPWFLAVAAAAALLLAALWPAGARGPEGHDGRQLGALWAAAYRDASARGFGAGCCEPGFDLSSACQQRFACRVGVAGDSGVTLVGGYQGLPTGGSLTVLARRGEAPVCVCVVPRRRDPRVELPPDSGLQLARRELGDVVVYALGSESPEAVLAAFVAGQP